MFLKIVWNIFGVTVCGAICVPGTVLAVENSANHSTAEIQIAEKNQTQVDALENILRDANALLNGSNPAEAYKVVEPLDLKYSGNAHFDYLLGVSALDSGYPDKAALAFERVLVVDPSFAGARLDMARAYF